MNEGCPLIGTWRLTDVARLDDSGGRHPPSAGWDAPSGYLIYTPEGRMMAILSTGARDAIGYPDIDDNKRIGAHKSMVAYTGKYEFHGDHVLHHVDIAWIPDWQGDTQKRYVELAGDRLTLTTPFGRRPDGSMARFELAWERA